MRNVMRVLFRAEVAHGGLANRAIATTHLKQRLATLFHAVNRGRGAWLAPAALILTEELSHAGNDA